MTTSRLRRIMLLAAVCFGSAVSTDLAVDYTGAYIQTDGVAYLDTGV